MERVVTTLRDSSRFPLFVISAGNDALPAYWGGYNRVRRDYPDQVLVVGAFNPSRSVSSFSNHGPEVDVYAPGEAVAVTR